MAVGHQPRAGGVRLDSAGALLLRRLFWLKGKLQTEEGKLVRDRWQLRVPVAGRIFLNLAVARFCRVLGTLLHNGVPILRSLDISAAAAGNRVLAVAIRDAAENVTEGQSLAGPLQGVGAFSDHRHRNDRRGRGIQHARYGVK